MYKLLVVVAKAKICVKDNLYFTVLLYKSVSAYFTSKQILLVLQSIVALQTLCDDIQSVGHPSDSQAVFYVAM